MSELAPIVIFVYNRLEHTQKLIESLKLNDLSKECVLYIYSDAPKNKDSEPLVNSVRSFIKSIEGFKAVNIIERTENFGLAKSIIIGVTEIVNKFGKVIVLEDDLVLSKYFLKYMNDALEIYKNETKVASIHGYVYPVKNKLPETFFLKGADCWGWATWKRAWGFFEPDGKKLLNELKNKKLTKRFDFNFSHPFTKMLEDQISGRNNSWAIRWNASAFINDMYTLYPGKSLVKNIGLDSSGVHCSTTEIYDSNINNDKVNIDNIEIKDSKVAVKEFEAFFRASSGSSFITSIKRFIKNINPL